MVPPEGMLLTGVKLRVTAAAILPAFRSDAEMTNASMRGWEDSPRMSPRLSAKMAMNIATRIILLRLLVFSLRGFAPPRVVYCQYNKNMTIMGKQTANIIIAA